MHVDEVGRSVGVSGASESTSGGGSSCIRIEVVCAEGSESCLISLPCEASVEQLKLMAAQSMQADPLTCVKMLHQFKLVHVGKRRGLRDGCSLREEELVDGDVVLLLQRKQRSDRQQRSTTDAVSVDMESAACSSAKQRRSGPSEAEILAATAGLQFKNMHRPTMTESANVDFERELRKILVTLIDYSMHLLHQHPEVQQVLQALSHDQASSRASSTTTPAEETVDAAALQQLTDMGFRADQARRALRLNHMSALEAMDWLLAYDSHCSTVASCHHVSCLQQRRRRNEAAASDGTAAAQERNTMEYPDVEHVVRAFRAHKRSHFQVNGRAAGNLLHLGFSQEEVMDALCLHGNNEAAAGEWLLSDRRPSSTDLRTGLGAQSPVRAALLRDAGLQLALMQPRILMSLVQLLQQPQPHCLAASRWLQSHDAVTQPVLSTIFRIFHSEKHAASPSHGHRIGDADAAAQEGQPLETDV